MATSNVVRLLAPIPVRHIGWVAVALAVFPTTALVPCVTWGSPTAAPASRPSDDVDLLAEPIPSIPTRVDRDRKIISPPGVAYSNEDGGHIDDLYVADGSAKYFLKSVVTGRFSVVVYSHRVSGLPDERADIFNIKPGERFHRHFTDSARVVTEVEVRNTDGKPFVAVLRIVP